MRCAQAIANVVSLRAKEAVEKLTGEKVTAKRMQPTSSRLPHLVVKEVMLTRSLIRLRSVSSYR